MVPETLSPPKITLIYHDFCPSSTGALNIFLFFLFLETLVHVFFQRKVLKNCSTYQSNCVDNLKILSDCIF